MYEKETESDRMKERERKRESFSEISEREHWRSGDALYAGG